MPHGVFGRKLKRNKDERRRLFMQLIRAMFAYGRIKTTLAKAKAVRPTVEKLITKAKSGTPAAVREITKTVSDVATEKRIAEWSKTRFSARTSGYTRIVKLGKRMGDASEMVILEFVDAAPVAPKAVKPEKPSGKAAAAAPANVQEADVVEEPVRKPARRGRKTSK